jgi:hypothetical protein
LLIQLRIQKLKVVHVVRYLEDMVLRIKQRARLRQVILVSVIQRRMKGRGRTVHRGVFFLGLVGTVCSTTQNPPPQHLVPPNTPVSAYLHRNVQKSMETNQTLQAVSVVLLNVLQIPVSTAPIPTHPPSVVVTSNVPTLTVSYPTPLHAPVSSRIAHPTATV